MSIRFKLLGLLCLNGIGILGALALVLLLYAPLEKMQEQQRYLFLLENSVTELQTEILLTGFVPMAQHSERVQSIWEESKKLVHGITELDTLLSAGETVKLSLSAVQSLGESFAEHWLDFENKLESLLATLEASGETDQSLLRLYRGSSVREEQRRALLIAEANTLVHSIDLLVKDLETVLSVMRSEFATIDAEIFKVRTKVFNTAALLFGVILFSGLLGAALMASSLAKNFTKFAAYMEVLSRGDLTGRLSIESKDDLRRLGDSLNYFVEELKRMLGRMCVAVGKTKEVKNQIIDSVLKTRQASTTIESSSRDMEGQIKKLDLRIEEATNSVEVVSRRTGEMLEMLEDHSTRVEETSASINQMIASIDSVSKAAKQRKETVSKLTDLNSRGREKLDTTIGQIVEATTMLQEFSTGLRERGQEMEASSSTLREMMQYTTETSQGVKETVTHIGIDLKRIGGAITEMEEITGELTAVTEEVEGGVNLFEIGEKAGCDLPEPLK